MSNMVVNTNVLALNSHRNLKTTGNKQTQASSRLSSGLKISSAADDAAGLAISEKMRAQIRGLDMASKNGQDAISLIQTAEGGMQEIDNMLQRIRELTVQASNDTNEHNSAKTGDRQKMQDEIDQLVSEIDSMASRVEFNKKKVIDGTYSDGKTPDIAKIDTKYQTATTPTTPVQDTSVQQAIADISTLMNTDADYLALVKGDDSTAPGVPADGQKVTSTGNGKYADLLQAIETAYGLGDKLTAADLDDLAVDLTDPAATGVLKAAYDAATKAVADDPGTAGEVKADAAMKTALENLAAKFKAIQETLQTPVEEAMPKGANPGAIENFADSVKALKDGGVIDAVLDPTNTDYKDSQDKWDVVLAADDAVKLEAAWKDFAAQLLLDDAAAKGGVGDTAGADLLADPDLALLGQVLDDKLAGYETSVVPDPDPEAVNTAKTLYFQVGSNAEQKLELNINSVNSKALGIGNGNADGKGTVSYINILKDSGVDITKILDGLDEALSYVTTERSKLGAAQNRLEYTIKSLDISSENLSAAESRIRDTDMAKEMMKLTQANVLQQAATSMLAQANQAPQSVLQLLQ